MLQQPEINQSFDLLFDLLMDKLIVTIMAGGIGKRMESDLPKVLHLVNGEPMIIKIIQQVLNFNPQKILIVVGKFKNLIDESINNFLRKEDVNLIDYVEQLTPLGTGDAIKCTLPYITNYKNKTNLILNGDTPMLKYQTLRHIVDTYNKSESNLLITAIELTNPSGNGRIIQKDGVFQAIVEEKDCDKDQKIIKICNCGIYVANTDTLLKYIPMINNKNAQNEYYLTDLVSIYKENEQHKVELAILPTEKELEIYNVNTKEQLLFVNQ